MKNKEDLKKELIKIDHKSYGMYKTLGGSYSYGNYILHIDHVQGDPFASPSRLRFEVKKETHGFPEEYYEEKHRRLALEDQVLRRFLRQLRQLDKGSMGSGKSGRITTCPANQTVQERIAVVFSKDRMELRFEMGFPARGRTIMAKEMQKLVFDILPELAESCLFYRKWDTKLYDGREKQTVADGIYEFGCGYQDDKNGGAKDQTAMEGLQKYTFKIMHITQNKYYIQNTEDGKYLSVVFQSVSRENAAKGKMGSYKLCWTEKPEEVRGQFELQRLNGAYTIQNVSSKRFLAEEKDSADSVSLTLFTGRSDTGSHWRIHATQKMSNTKKPFVITQYDPEWCATPYGGGGCMGTAGCGILATVNAVYALNGQYMDVMELANYAVKKNYRIVGSGTDDGIFKAAAKKYGKKYGFAWDGGSGSIDILKKKLKAGDTAIVHVQGHYVCISDYNKKTKKYLLLDSNYLPKRATSAFGDWIKVDRLLSGALESQYFYFFKLSEK